MHGQAEEKDHTCADPTKVGTTENQLEKSHTSLIGFKLLGYILTCIRENFYYGLFLIWKKNYI